jgi:hypothetical protein
MQRLALRRAAEPPCGVRREPQPAAAVELRAGADEPAGTPPAEVLGPLALAPAAVAARYCRESADYMVGCARSTPTRASPMNPCSAGAGGLVASEQLELHATPRLERTDDPWRFGPRERAELRSFGQRRPIVETRTGIARVDPRGGGCARAIDRQNPM